MLKPLLLAAAALGLAANTAQAWIAENGLVVTPTGSGTFDVPYRGKSKSRDFWCAAGDYVYRELGLSGTTRIYRTSRPPRRAGEGISFSLSPEAAQRPGLAVIGFDRGLSAAHAMLLCEDWTRR